MLFSALCLLAASLSVANTAAVSNSTGPVVKTSHGSFQGVSTSGVDAFLGMPFAQPPLGNLRFRKPLSALPFKGVKDATKIGNSCLQQAYPASGNIPGLDLSILGVFYSVANVSEDCLNLNVYRPAGVSAHAKLPVVIYLYGGAFTTGDASAYNAANLVARSVDLGEPVIYVSLNYRVNAFGFLAGKEVMDEKVANLGIWDQILGQAWIQAEIAAFGGDPEKVTLWGQSAGALSATAHMVLNANNPSPPFRAAIFDSSYTLPMRKTDSPKDQKYYDYLVEQTNCSSLTSTLDCLRKVPSDILLDVVNTTPSSLSANGLNFTWFYSADNVLFNKSMKEYVRDGQYTKIPVIGGCNNDEGTLFSLTENITTSDEFTSFITEQYLPGAPDSQIAAIVNAYSPDPAAGCPFGTGSRSELTPQYKRLAAFHGDWQSHSGHMETMGYYKHTQNVWSYLWKRDQDLLYLGSLHGAELPELYSFVSTDFVGTDALVNFANNLDPNYPTGSSANSTLFSITWPKYNQDMQMLQFSDNSTEAYTTTTDNYREVAIQAIIEVQNTLGL